MYSTRYTYKYILQGTWADYNARSDDDDDDDDDDDGDEMILVMLHALPIIK